MQGKRLLAAVVCLVILFGCVVTGEEPVGKKSVEPVEICATRRNPGDRHGAGSDGISLGFIVRFDGKRVIRPVYPKCVLTEFTDNTGRVLRKPGNLWRRQGVDAIHGYLTDDRSAAVFSVASEDILPAKEATKLRLRGKVGVLVGTHLRNGTLKDVEIVRGKKLSFPGFVMSISKTGHSDKTRSLTLESTEIDRLISIVFLDEHGQTIKHDRWGATVSPKGGYSSFDYTLKKVVNRVTVKVRYVAGAQEVMVPVDILAGLGLSAEPAKAARRTGQPTSRLAAETDATVSVQAIRIGKGVDEPFAAVWTRIKFKNRMIIRNICSASVLTMFQDDIGTVLAKPGKFDPKAPFTWAGIVSDRDRRNAITVGFGLSSVAPAKGASRLTLKARVVLLTGANEKETCRKNIHIRKGAIIDLGDIKLRIKKAPPRPDYGTTFVLESAKLSHITKITFFDADGNEVVPHRIGGGDWDPLIHKGKTRGIGFKQKLDVMTVNVRYFSKVERVVVPVDVSPGLGL